jgi:hypothetical protein
MLVSTARDVIQKFGESFLQVIITIFPLFCELCDAHSRQFIIPAIFFEAEISHIQFSETLRHA